jgi:hypothetical protein
MKIFSPILKGTTTVSQGTTNLSGSFTGSLLGTAATASYADNFTVGGTLTAQTINVQIITSSIEFNTGSTRNGSSTANTHQFTGSVLMSGSLGIGTSSPGSPLTFYQSAYNKTTLGDARVIRLENSDPTVQLNSRQEIGFGYSTAYQPVVIGHQITNNTDFTNGSFYIAVRSGITNSAPTQVLTVTSAGNVGIGTTSPNDLLEIKTTLVNQGNIRLYNTFNAGASSNGLIWFRDYDAVSNTIGAYIYYTRTGGSAGDMTFGSGTNSGVSERMRIISSGNIVIGKTEDSVSAETTKGIQFQQSGRILCTVDGTYSAFSRLSSDGDIITFHRGTTSKVGSISVTTSNVAYNTSASDIRLKKNFENWNENVLSSFEDLNPQKFNFINQEDGTDKVKGFIAQEVIGKFPEAYPVDDSGYYSFNPSGMTTYLMKAIQELSAKNTLLEERLTALENN